MSIPLSIPAANILTASGQLDPYQPSTTLQLPDGRTIVLATSLLVPTPDVANKTAEDDMIAFPIIEEQLEVGKRTIETAKISLEKRVTEYQESLDVPLAVRSYDIERVVLNRPVDAAPSIRQEGETTVYPLVEEQLVITTQLILKEELRVTKRETERRDTRTVTLKREIMDVTRTPLA